MICPVCEGTGIYYGMPGACPECIAGVVSCCDTAGAGDWLDEQNRAVEAREQQAARLVAEASYRNPSFFARKCDHCGKTYRGPAVYCSLECALADA